MGWPDSLRSCPECTAMHVTVHTGGPMMGGGTIAGADGQRLVSPSTRRRGEALNLQLSLLERDWPWRCHECGHGKPHDLLPRDGLVDMLSWPSCLGRHIVPGIMGAMSPYWRSSLGAIMDGTHGAMGTSREHHGSRHFVSRLEFSPLSSKTITATLAIRQTLLSCNIAVQGKLNQPHLGRRIVSALLMCQGPGSRSLGEPDAPVHAAS